MPKTGIAIPDVDAPKAEVVFIEKLRDHILDGMADEDFGVKELAEQVSVSRRTLSNRVKQITEKTPSTLIREVRLERAHQLLEAEAGTISEVAYSVGFKSVAHFSRTFKVKYKKTPSEVITAL
jgi:transcriptional regulator GlxA family with amidase domain